MKSKDLCDTFSCKGKSIEEFADLLRSIDKSTYTMDMETDEITLLPIIDPYEFQEELLSILPPASPNASPISLNDFNDKLLFVILGEKPIMSFLPPRLRTISKKQILDKGGTEALFKETKEKSRLLIKYGEKRMFFTSPKLPGTMCAKAGLKGSAVFDASPERAAFIMQRFRNPQKVVALVRKGDEENNGIQKIMALFSGKYAYIPQSILLEIIAKLKVVADECPVCRCWEVDHFVSSIFLEFPGRAELFKHRYGLPDYLIPGIRLSTSDVGDSSLSARAAWRIEESFIEGDAINVEHSGIPKIDDFAMEIDRKIIQRFPEFLNRLNSFSGVAISDPVQTFSRLFDKLEIRKAIGKKKAARILENHEAENRDRDLQSGYDLITTLLKLPGRYRLSSGPAMKFREAAYRAVFYDDIHCIGQKAARKAG